MSEEPRVLYEDHEQHFKVVIAPCLITHEFDVCILAKLTDFEIEDKNGTTYPAEIFGQFSESGLLMLLDALRSAPLPIPLETPDQIRVSAIYHWEAVLEDNRVIRQFEEDGTEHHLGHVDLTRVQQFWVLPRDSSSALPLYCLNRETGLCRAERMGEYLLPLGLPFPEVSFHIEYQRRVTKTFTCGAPGYLGVPTQIVHELGWRVDTLHGDDYETKLLIGIEDENGMWQVAKKEPAFSRHFQEQEALTDALVVRPRVVEASGLLLP